MALPYKYPPPDTQDTMNLTGFQSGDTVIVQVAEGAYHYEGTVHDVIGDDVRVWLTLPKSRRPIMYVVKSRLVSSSEDSWRRCSENETRET